MREPKNFHFYDFGISGQRTQHQLFLSSETPGCPKESKDDSQIMFEKTQPKIWFEKIQFFENPTFLFVGKDGRRNNPTIR